MKQYKGYDARIEYDADAAIFHGRVPNIRGAITFEGWSVEELEREFHASVDAYLEFCELNDVEPAKPFSGNFVLRTGPDLHGRLAAAAARSGASLNAWIVDQLEAAVSATGRAGAAAQRPAAKKLDQPKSVAKKVATPPVVKRAVAKKRSVRRGATS